MAREEKKPLSRPSKRKLVRWNENLDELLLLTIQSVCNQEGVKIPWAEVAKSMANNVTEGAIVQHLAKLRTRRVQKAKEVPPPLRRGGVGGAASTNFPETPATPRSREQSVAEDSNVRHAETGSNPRIKTEKRAASDSGDYTSSDSDKEWSSSPRSKSSKKRKHRRSHKKRKPAPPAEVFESGVDGNDDDDDAAEGSIASVPDTEMVAVGAEFLEFSSEQARATPVSEDDDQDDMSKSLIVKFKLGEKNYRQLKHKGTGVYHDRDPEQRWTLPSPGPNGEKWGFNRDYYGPVPKSTNNPQNPGLLRGEWPLEVAMRQYDAPQAVTWANETHEPDPRLVHPAKYLEKPGCEPQLKMHRKLRPMEESNPDARILDQERPAYQSYVKTHRELPTYFDPGWNAAPTQPSNDYPMEFPTTNGASSSMTAAAPNAFLYQHGDVNSYNVAHPQMEDAMDTHRMLGVNHTETLDTHVDRHTELPPENNGQSSTINLPYEDPQEVEGSAFNTAFESFIDIDHEIDSFFPFV